MRKYVAMSDRLMPLLEQPSHHSLLAQPRVHFQLYTLASKVPLVATCQNSNSNTCPIRAARGPKEVHVCVCAFLALAGIRLLRLYPTTHTMSSQDTIKLAGALKVAL